MFSILGKLSLNIQSDDFILSVAVSQLKETVASMSYLKSRHAPNCYLETFLKVPNNLGKKDLKVFQGIELEGNSRVEKRIGSGPNFNSGVNKTSKLCLDGLKERFGLLMDSPSSSARHTSYGPSKVVQDFLIFNIDSWPKNDSG